MRIFPAVIAVGLLMTPCASPAIAADDAATVQAREADATAKVGSMQIDVTTTSGSTMLATHVTVVMPNFAATVTLPTGQTEIVQVDGVLYQRQDGGPWSTSRAIDPQAFLASFGISKTRQVTLQNDTERSFTLLPDRIEDGGVVGVTQVTTPTIPQMPAVTVVCSYDKTTYLKRSCEMTPGTGMTVKMMYSHYNDRSNVVTAPADAPPLPSASAAPGPVHT